jgi:hypothetical protein
MKPWVEVAIVGSDTLGKPVGQLAFDLSGCPDRLRLIAFKTVNSANEGDYYDGLASTLKFACAAADTLDVPLGSANDNMTRAALNWLSTGACGAVIASNASAAMKSQARGRCNTHRPRRPSAGCRAHTDTAATCAALDATRTSPGATRSRDSARQQRKALDVVRERKEVERHQSIDAITRIDEPVEIARQGTGAAGKIGHASGRRRSQIASASSLSSPERGGLT